MKKITLSIALITLASMAVFAAGSAEENTMPWAKGQSQYQSDAVISEDTTTITGTINLVEDGHVELVTDSGTFELVYPYRLSYAADIQDGMEITVEGFEAENLRLDNDAATKNLVLKSATIDGETYDLADLSNNFGRSNQRGNQGTGNRFDDNSSVTRQAARGNAKGNMISGNSRVWDNQQAAPIGQRGRNSNQQGGFAQDSSFGRGRR
ncbi:MAG: hypothetical protein KAQ93_00060 [Spirochaetales bacterium]|nr:hypothetical protein [Spirochaetales bacterium]